MTERLSCKTVPVTGASSGIGAACVRALAAEGADFVLTARREDRLRALRTEVEKTGSKAVVAAGDAREEETARRAVEAPVKTFGRLDILTRPAHARIIEVQMRTMAEPLA